MDLPPREGDPLRPSVRRRRDHRAGHRAGAGGTATPAIGTQESVAMYEPIEGCSRVRRWAGLDDRRPGDARPLHPAGPSDGITNDLGYRFALPATAPIPPSPTDSSARFGAAEGTMMATDASLPQRSLHDPRRARAGPVAPTRRTTTRYRVGGGRVPDSRTESLMVPTDRRASPGVRRPRRSACVRLVRRGARSTTGPWT